MKEWPRRLLLMGALIVVLFFVFNFTVGCKTPVPTPIPPTFTPTLTFTSTPTPTSTSFYYQVRVLAENTGEYVQNAKVTIELRQEVPPSDMTDMHGLAVIVVGSSCENDLVKLIVEATGYTRYTEYVSLKRDALPKIVELERNELPTGTPTATFTPTSTPTSSPTATFTPTSIPTSTPTATFTHSPTPTFTTTTTCTPSWTLPPRPTATFTPSCTPTSYSPPTLIGAQVIGCYVTLKWSWSGKLADDEWFAVRIGTDSPHSRAWIKECEYLYPVNDGRYYWEIAICKGKREDEKCSKGDGSELAVSERREFSVGGCP